MFGKNQGLRGENEAKDERFSAARQMVLHTELGSPETWRNPTLASAGSPPLDNGTEIPSESSVTQNISTNQKTSSA